MEKADTLKRWIFKQDKMTTLLDLKNINLVFQILNEIDSTYFRDIAFSINESKRSQKYNVQELVKFLKKFYLEFIGVDIKDEAFGLKDYLKNDKENDFIEISELIAGIAAQCSNKKYYLDIMQNDLVSYDQKVMFNILDKVLSGPENNSFDENNHHEDKSALLLKIDMLEAENKTYKEKNQSQSNKINELITTNNRLEQNYYEMEQKYNDLMISTSMHEKTSVDSQKNFGTTQLEDFVNLSIQFSELKGKLEAKEQTLLRIKEEKEILYLDLSKKNLVLKQENDELKENNLKYELLKENFEKTKKALEDLHIVSNKNNYLEKLIKQSEERLNKYKNYENDKNKLLKRIEELNFELSEQKEKYNELLIKKDHYLEYSQNLEHEIKIKNLQSKNTLVIEEKYQLPDFSKLNENTEAEAVFVKPVNALSEIENEVLKQQVSENEIKMKEMISQNELLQKKINTLIEEKDSYLKEIYSLKVSLQGKTILETQYEINKQKYEKLILDFRDKLEENEKKYQSETMKYILNIKNLETELASSNSKKLNNNLEHKDTVQIDKSLNLTLSHNYENLNLKLMLEKSNESLEFYKKREKVYEEQEIFLTNMIYNISRELIINKFIRTDT